MELKNFFVQDDAGNILNAATCYLYERGTESLVEVLQGANGLSLSNPFMSDQQGLVQFAAPDGLYDLRVVKGSRDYRLRIQCNDVTQTLAATEGSIRAFEEQLNDSSDPTKGLGMLGYRRQSPNAQIERASEMISSFWVSIWEFAKYATGYSAGGDVSTWDWTPATIEAMAATPMGVIWYPPEHVYKHNSGLKVNVRKHSLESRGAVLDFSGMPNGEVAIQLFGFGVWGYLYEGSRGGVFGIEIRGASRNSASVGIEWVGADSISTPANSEVGNLFVTEFGIGILSSDHSYNIAHNRGMVSYCGIGIAVRGTVNSGERININDFVISGCSIAIDAAGGGSDIYVNNCSLDFNRKALASSAFKVEFNNTHVEQWNDGIDGSPIILTGQAKFRMNGGVLLGQRDTVNYDYFINAADSSSALFDGVRLHNINSAKGFDTGTGAVVIKNPMLNLISQVKALRKDGMLRDPSFALNDIAADLIYISNFTGTRTSRTATSGLVLSTSSAFAATGGYSLRAEKSAGSGAVATFTILVPCQHGEQFNLQFKCLNPSSRNGVLDIRQGFGIYSGNDGAGIPILNSKIHSTWASITPTNQWGLNHNSLNVYASGGADSLAPIWANVAVFEFRMFAFLGGANAPEGGAYSLYFDDINISKW